MPSSYLHTTPLAEAVSLFTDMVRSKCRPLATEVVPVSRACGRILSEAVYAKISAPHYYASAMDGVAMRAADGFGASETTPIALMDFETVDTGDPVPPQYNCVVMVEDVVDVGGHPGIICAPTPWQHIRQIGEDICQGEMAFPAYTCLSASAVGALAACGITQVKALKQPVVAIIPTGDEIVAPSEAPARGEVMEFSSLIFSGMLAEWGAAPKTYPIVPDDLEQIKSALQMAAAECDVVILTAGSSKGRGDFSAQVIGALGTVLLHGVAIRPGKPVILGEIGGRPVIGAPGYPVSGVIALRELLRPALECLCHAQLPTATVVLAVLGRKLVSPLQYEEFVRCRLARIGERLVAMPLGSGASIVTSFARSDGLIRVPQNVDLLAAGAAVSVELARDIAVIERTISITGSHDPLFDELADILGREGERLRVASSHVGSMGAINAVLSGQTHAGGVHLLDEATGAYNASWLRRYFPRGGVRLLRGVGRVQGIMVAPENPLSIASIADLVRTGVRYVNRQRGAGTRLLLDYLLKHAGIDPDNMFGYDREELTHFSVAVQIAAGSADAGLGVYAAARAYGLDFIPVYTERYDVLISEAFAQDSRFAAFHSAFCGDELKARLQALGGYETDAMGEWIDWQTE